ncbi:transcription factor bHLH30-like [Impatiens glandulifera]|uniref:transcription factor bHLH30-like n=1 Tax=Impatiens glandulifera TaxID=253017 RepID=UPI001FB05C2E|nr:transcription factor bHLH30-like [Impatiens glandulifera]
MMGDKEEEDQEQQQLILLQNDTLQAQQLQQLQQEQYMEIEHHHQHHQQQHHQHHQIQTAPSSSSQILPWSLPPVHPLHNFPQNPVLFPPQYPYGGHFINRLSTRPSSSSSSLHFASYDTTNTNTTPPISDHHLRFISESLGRPNGSGPFGLGAELGMKMTAQEIMDAKALAASKSHSEAERRRRERINNHLAKLRSLLPSTTKTDKASLLAEVIQHVKELKRQTSVIAENNTIPSETDELSMMDASDEDGKLVIKASLCCEDRADLLPDLIKTLKSLKLKTLKAEITTLGGRVRNILFITGEEDEAEYTLNSVEEALKGVMEKGGNNDESSSGTIKRQRTTSHVNMP